MVDTLISHGVSFICRLCKSHVTLRFELYDVLKAKVETGDISRADMDAWLLAWSQLTPMRAVRGDALTVYPPYISPVFERPLIVMGQLCARYAHRHHGIFAPYIRPFIQRSWAAALQSPTPLVKVGKHWNTAIG